MACMVILSTIDAAFSTKCFINIHNGGNRKIGEFRGRFVGVVMATWGGGGFADACTAFPCKSSIEITGICKSYNVPT